MNALVKFVEAHGGAMDVSHEEPTVLDVTLGEILGYQQPRNIRRLIERHIDDLPGIRQASQLTRLENTGNLPDTISVDVYHLNEEQALFVASKAETPISNLKMREFISLAVKMRKALEFTQGLRAPSPMTPESIALLATKVASETTFAMLRAFGTKRVRKALDEGHRAALGLPAHDPTADPWKPLFEGALEKLPSDVEAISVKGAYVATFGESRLDRFTRSAQMRTGQILRSLGWSGPQRFCINGERKRLYGRPARPS